MYKVPGSWEHMCLFWKEVKVEKTNKLNLAAIWLDVANAYGSIQLLCLRVIQDRLHIGCLFKILLQRLFGQVIYTHCSIQFASAFQRDLYSLHSLNSFLTGMNVILFFIFAGIDISFFQFFLSPPVKAFMHDFFLMSPSLQQTQVLLSHAVIAFFWTRMSVKFSKSGYLVFGKEKMHCPFYENIQEQHLIFMSF